MIFVTLTLFFRGVLSKCLVQCCLVGFHVPCVFLLSVGIDMERVPSVILHLGSQQQTLLNFNFHDPSCHSDGKTIHDTLTVNVNGEGVALYI